MGDMIEEDKKDLNIGVFICLFVIRVSQKFQGKGYDGKMLRVLIEKSKMK